MCMILLRATYTLFTRVRTDSRSEHCLCSEGTNYYLVLSAAAAAGDRRWAFACLSIRDLSIYEYMHTPAAALQSVCGEGIIRHRLAVGVLCLLWRSSPPPPPRFGDWCCSSSRRYCCLVVGANNYINTNVRTTGVPEGTYEEVVLSVCLDIIERRSCRASKRTTTLRTSAAVVGTLYNRYTAAAAAREGVACVRVDVETCLER